MRSWDVSQSNMQKASARGGRDGMPALAAEIAINPDGIGAERPLREIRQNERKVARARDHRMLAVGVALTGGARVDVHIGNHAQAAPLADIPKRPAMAAVEPNNAGVQRMW